MAKKLTRAQSRAVKASRVKRLSAAQKSERGLSPGSNYVYDASKPYRKNTAIVTASLRQDRRAGVSHGTAAKARASLREGTTGSPFIERIKRGWHGVTDQFGYRTASARKGGETRGRHTAFDNIDFIPDLKARLGRERGSRYRPQAITRWSDYQDLINRHDRGEEVDVGEWFEALDIAAHLGDPAYARLLSSPGSSSRVAA
jgi:hypothetical protein